MSAQPTELRALLAKDYQSAPPWRVVVRGCMIDVESDGGQVAGFEIDDDAHLAAAAVNALPALLDKIERLEAAILGMIEAHDHGEPEDWFNRRQIALRELKEQP